jgi:hypothetical protein
MQLTKLILLFSVIHFFLVILLFLVFGLGLEGKHSIGHLVLWVLLLPGALLPGSWLFTMFLNSITWGFCCAMALVGFRYIREK